MKLKTPVLAGILGVLLLVAGVVAYKAAFATKPKPVATEEEEVVETLPAADAAISVSIAKSKVKDNTVVLSVSGLAAKYAKLSYELSYETQGIVQGVTSAPLDIADKGQFVRDDIYLGTCSRNVCKPHTGVKNISAVIIFTDTSGAKSQYTGEFEL